MRMTQRVDRVEDQALLNAPAYQLSAQEVLEQLESDPERGLDQAEATGRRARFGENLLRESGRAPWYQLLLRQFADLLIIILFVAAALAWYLGDIRGALLLLAIILINGFIGVFQEFHAEQLLEKLKLMMRSQARAIRDGEVLELDAQSLVPGDVVLLEEGCAVPADLRLIESEELATNDFMLTGESLPQNKDADFLPTGDLGLSDQDNLAFMGTTVARGSATGVVVATGMASAVGQIAEVGQGIRRDISPLQREINTLAILLARMAGVIAVALFAINILLHSDDFSNLSVLVNSSALFAIGVAAACVPQGLPAQITVALSLGVGRMARENAVVKRLSSVETLGCTTVICSDKTGTITSNQMTIVRAWADGNDYEITGQGYDPAGEILKNGEPLHQSALDQVEQFFQHGLLASTGRTHEPDADHPDWYALGDPTEAAFTALAMKAGLDPDERLEAFPVLEQLPFDSRRKRMTILRAHKERVIGFMKGATASVLEACSGVYRNGQVVPLDDRTRAVIIDKMETFSADSLRVIALAFRDFPADQRDFPLRDTEREFVFAGLAGMLDPPREGVRGAIDEVRDAHIRVLMLTGDGPITAQAIAEKIGMPDGEVYTGDTLRQMPDDELKQALTEESVILSRVSPQEKYRVVQLLKSLGEVVAVTGDGVNDTLSLKRADIGVAMGKQGSDVAKEAAEIVLTDDDFTTLVLAVREGRTIYQNLKSVILASITSNLGELSCVCFGFVGAALGLPIPITAVQILSIDLMGEMLPLMALVFDPPDAKLMQHPPRRLDSHMIDKKRLWELVCLGLLMGLGGYFSFSMVLFTGGTTEMAQAATFLGIILIQYMNILSRRTNTSVFGEYFYANRPLLASIVFSLALVVVITSVPIVGNWFGFEALRITDWIWPLSAALGFLACFETLKWFTRQDAVGQPS